MFLARVWRMMCAIMQNTAMPRPSAVLYMASAMPFESMRCLSAWERPGAAMAPNVAIRPLTVPSRPIRVAMFASDQSAPTRFSACGLSSLELLAERRVDLVRTLVGVRQARLDELQDRVVARVAELDRAVDVAGGHELLDLREELLRVHAVPGELERKALDHDGQHDRRRDEVHHQEGRVVLEGLDQLARRSGTLVLPEAGSCIPLPFLNFSTRLLRTPHGGCAEAERL